jgi:hypothetical protein
MGIGFADYGLERFQITPLIISSCDLVSYPLICSSTLTVWPVANLALFVPFTLSEMVTIKRLVVLKGSTAGGTIDVGLYDANGTRLVSSGSTPLTTSAGTQFFDIADTQLNAGRYYLAAVTTGTVAVICFPLITGSGSFVGLREMAAAFPLPATAVFTDNLLRSVIPAIALTLTAA